MKTPEPVDAPILFEGILFIESEAGSTAEVTLTLGYGDVPTEKTIREVVDAALQTVFDRTGVKWRLPAPRTFIGRAIHREYGEHMAVGGPVADEYQMVGKPLDANDASLIPQPDYGDLFEAYLRGAQEGQRHPDASEAVIRKSADAFCKLTHLEKDPESFEAMGNAKEQPPDSAGCEVSS